MPQNLEHTGDALLVNVKHDQLFFSPDHSEKINLHLCQFLQVSIVSPAYIKFKSHRRFLDAQL